METPEQIMRAAMVRVAELTAGGECDANEVWAGEKRGGGMGFNPPCDTFVAWKGHFVEILSHDPGNYLEEGTRPNLETGRVWTFSGVKLDWVAGQMFAAQHRPAIYRLLRRFLDAEAESAQVDAEEERQDTMEGRR